MDMPDVLFAPAREALTLPANRPDDPLDIEALRRLVVAKLTYATGRDPQFARDRDWFVAAALALRDHIVESWLASTRADTELNRKRVYYLSLEFLPGRMLLDSLNNAGL